MTTGAGGILPVERATAAAVPQVAPAPDVRALVEQHFAFIARSLRRLGVWEIDVDDAAQQVFLVAARKRNHLIAGNEKPFLFGIALRVASESRRARRRRAAGEQQAAVAQSMTAVAVTPEQLAADRQARALLDEILDAMPEKIRVVFTLFELEELTMAEIATILDVPPGSVASRLRRGRALFHSQAARLRSSPGPVGSRR